MGHMFSQDQLQLGSVWTPPQETHGNLTHLTMDVIHVDIINECNMTNDAAVRLTHWGVCLVFPRPSV